jgi:hypothetical protein
MAVPSPVEVRICPNVSIVLQMYTDTALVSLGININKVSFYRSNSYVLWRLLDIRQVKRRVLLGTCHMGLAVN